MSDIFREVEEDVRRERLQKFWKRYGNVLLALAALVVAGVVGWQLWTRYDENQRTKISADFTAAQRIGNPAQAAAAFARIGAGAPGGYRELARLSQANGLLASGKADDAVALYKNIAADDSGAVGAVARLRAAWVLADTAPRADLAALLDPLNTPTSAWRQMAREILAYADYKAGNAAAAGAAFAALAADPDSPDALRSRARAFAAFLQNGGAANYGSVPPPPPASAPGTPPAPAP